MGKLLVLLIILVCISELAPTCFSQKKKDPPKKKAAGPPVSTLNETCDGIYLSYEYVAGRKIPPVNATRSVDPTHRIQPYRFESTLTVLNNGWDELKDWKVFVDFQYREILVSVSGGVLPQDKSDLPANVSTGATFSGFPLTDLKSGIQTAGDLTQMMAKVDLVGVEFGVPPKDKPIPRNFTLLNQGYLCQPKAATRDENTTEICCQVDPNYKANSSQVKFSARETGDLTIMYDVLKAYPGNYLAQVTLSNEDPLARLDYWQLGWQWTRGEFIYKMRGAYPRVIDPSSCVYGPQPRFYKEMDLSSVLTCDPNPIIVDLPPSMKNDTELGLLPECCRNGTILPSTMDPTKSKSVFQMTVFKMPPDLNLTTFYPPQHWTINGSSTEQVYSCGEPIRVTPTLLVNPQGLPSEIEAIASWQVVCNRTQVSYPKCCVSFSSYLNDYAIPCRTCACGCRDSNKKLSITTTTSSAYCNATADPMLLPPYALLRPFPNRTDIASEYARVHRLPIPDPLPCPDNCGVTINWHLNSDFDQGWSSKITILNWGDLSYNDWSLAVTLDKAGRGFVQTDKFNGSTLQNDSSTVFMHGFYHLNDYLNAIQNGTDFPNPGMLQSLLFFDKKNTPGINVGAGPDGFPVRVFFNGAQCSLPTMLPALSKAHLLLPVSYSLLLAAFVLVFIMFQ